MTIAVADSPALLTPDEVLAMPDGERYELIHGVLREPPVSIESSRIGGKMFTALDLYLEETGLGEAFAADLQVRIWPDRRHMRKVDAAVVLATRVVGGLVADGGYLEIAPDIVAEVVSRRDEAEDVEEKVREYLGAGVGLIWVAYPRTRTVHVYRADGSVEVLDDSDDLDGTPLLPGFRFPVARLFRRNPRG